MRIPLMALLLATAITACGDDTAPEDAAADSALGDATPGDAAADALACTSDMDCDDGNACNGVEDCDPLTRTCRSTEPLDCDDLDPCTVDTCEEIAGCLNIIEDEDMDGFAPADTCTTPGFMGGDCNDANADVYPGAPELCDAADNDCNDIVDDVVTCLADIDEDGYGDPSTAVSACECPVDFIQFRVGDETDCADHVHGANPGQTEPSGVGYCPTPGVACIDSALVYDWNCDGSETRTAALAGECRRDGGTCAGSGFLGADRACGAPRDYERCVGVLDGGCAIAAPMTRPQPCL